MDDNVIVVSAILRFLLSVHICLVMGKKYSRKSGQGSRRHSDACVEQRWVGRFSRASACCLSECVCVERERDGVSTLGE